MPTELEKRLPLPAHPELRLQRCKRCDHLFFYPREVRPVCLSPELEWAPVSGKGRLHSFTVIYQPDVLAFQEDIPYIYAMVQLNEVPRMASNLVDCPIKKAQGDMPVAIVFNDVTSEWTLVTFRPV